jgi:hypothetical protein
MSAAARAVAKAVPNTVHRELRGQSHAVDPLALASELLEFFVT